MSIDLLEKEANLYEDNFLQAYECLNPEQKQAVDQVEGPVMVIAGPGTGKTQVLALRIAKILRDQDLQVNPSEILCLTFTESAVQAMRNRLMEFIGSDAYRVNIFTFHAFANQIIKDNEELFDLRNQIDDLEKIQVIQGILDNEISPGSPIKPFGDNYYYVKAIISYLKTLKQENISLDFFAEKIHREQSFFDLNAPLLDSIRQVNARELKKDPSILEKFFDNLKLSTQEFPEYLKLFRDYYETSETATIFKNKLKGFYEDRLKHLPKQHELIKVYKAYIAKLKDKKLYDYEDMILKVLEHFDSRPDLLLSYQEKFQYFLVDEYQDTNSAQNALVKQLASFHKTNANVFVVGDDDQSIYRFQGASLENLFSFSSYYAENLSSVALNKNYRSRQDILDLATALIKNNDSRIVNQIKSLDKTLNSQVDETKVVENVDHYEMRTKQEQYYHLASNIKNIIDSGVRLSDIAVIYRENKEAFEVAEALSRFGILFKTQLSQNLLEETLINQFVDLLYLILDPDKYFHKAYLVLNYDFVLQSKRFTEANVTVTDVFALTKKLKREYNQSPFETLLADEKFGFFAKHILELNQKAFNLKLDMLVEYIAQDFGLYDYIFKQENSILLLNYFSSFYDYLRSLIEQKSFLAQDEFSPFNLKDFLEHLDLMKVNGIAISPSPLDSDLDAVNLMTAHKSKGLEFDYVFIPNLQNKLWGNKTKRSLLKYPNFLLQETDSLLAQDELEEERRLFFVAITRAKHKLGLYSFQENDKAKASEASMFLTELPTELYKKTKPILTIEEQQEKLENSLKHLFVDYLAQSREFLESNLKSYRLSVTHLNNYLDCPRKFFYQNFIRIPAAKDKFAALGTAVHNALCDLFAILKNDKLEQKLAIEKVLEAFELHLKNEYLLKADYEEALQRGRQILEEYIANYYDLFNLDTLQEYDFASQNLVVEGLLLAGKLDKIEILENDEINVVDYKTGRPHSKDLAPGGKAHRQIVFYQLLCDLAQESPNFKYKMISGELDYVAKQNEKFRKEKITVSAMDLDNLKTEIREFKTGLENFDFPMTEDKQECTRCNFKNICKR